VAATPMTTPPRTPTTAAGRALLTMNTPGPDAGQVSDFHSGYCDGLTGHECSCDLPFAILAIEAEARAPLDVLNARIAWEDVLDGLEVALSYPAEMEVNRERWRAARINLLAALAALEEPTP